MESRNVHVIFVEKLEGGKEKRMKRQEDGEKKGGREKKKGDLRWKKRGSESNILRSVMKEISYSFLS